MGKNMRVLLSSADKVWIMSVHLNVQFYNFGCHYCQRESLLWNLTRPHLPSLSGGEGQHSSESQMYLSKKLNVFLLIIKCICLKCISPNFTMYEPSSEGQGSRVSQRHRHLFSVRSCNAGQDSFDPLKRKSHKCAAIFFTGVGLKWLEVGLKLA